MDSNLTGIGRALELARQQGMNQTALALRLGIKPQHVSNWKLRGLPSERVAELAALLQCSTDYLLGASDAPGLSLIAHPLTLDVYTVPVIQMAEDIVQGKVAAEFRFLLPDDALAPDRPARTDIVWSRDKQPRIGSIVLVVDQHNQLHARRYGQGMKAGHWLAEATNPAYRTFTSADVRLLAVAKYREEP